MSRLRGFADLAGRRVGLFGYGVEGRAAERRVKNIAAEMVIVDDSPDAPRGVLASIDGGLVALASCDVVLKSPGIPRRRDDVTALERETTVTSALNLWLLETRRDRVIAVTGTKGKSTTVSLITYFLTALGQSSRSAGNIGEPPYDPEIPDAEWTVLEVSSFQSLDLEVAPSVVVVTALGEDHLDWHGDRDTYVSDKLAITRADGAHATIVADTVATRKAWPLLGGEIAYVSPVESDIVQALGLIGSHNASNVALALEAVATALSRSVESLREALSNKWSGFTPLAGRLTLIRTHGGLRFIDDGLATSPLPVIAALESLGSDRVAVILGGFDRGVDYSTLIEAIASRPSVSVVATGPAGSRMAGALRSRGVRLEVAATMHDAVDAAITQLDGHGTVLLSPGAPSFDRYRDWKERSAEFARVVASLA